MTCSNSHSQGQDLEDGRSFRYNPDPALSPKTPHSLDDGVLKLLGTPPLADTGQAVGVVTAGENAEPSLRSGCLLKDHFHADATYFVLTCLEGEGFLHLMFKCQHAHLEQTRRHKPRL